VRVWSNGKAWCQQRQHCMWSCMGYITISLVRSGLITSISMVRCCGIQQQFEMFVVVKACLPVAQFFLQQDGPHFTCDVQWVEF
jgi:hypothetical protein